LKIGM